MRARILIPPKRMRWIPDTCRLEHEYCFFLHDQCVHVLVEYEKARANLVSFRFHNSTEQKTFERIANKTNSVAALRNIGRATEARRVIINTITLAMSSDCLHHIYEALRCMEKRKFVVGLNLLRKPLLDSLIYLSWILGDEENFYESFSMRSPNALGGSTTGQIRGPIIAKALNKTALVGIINPQDIESILFDKKSLHGLHGLMQRAVHLITTLTPTYATEGENFNFIFKSHADDDIYIRANLYLPRVMLYLSHIIIELFDRMQSMDAGAKSAFQTRTQGAYTLIMHPKDPAICKWLSQITGALNCSFCKAKPVFNHHNGVRALMADTFKCANCRRINEFPFSYAF